MRYRIKLFPEITIKSRAVRQEMVRCLRTNIRNAFARQRLEVRVADCWDALEVRPRREADAAALAQLEEGLTRIPGIHEVQAVETHAFTTFAAAAEQVVPYWRSAIAGRRFRVSVKRRGRHAFTSEALERYLGGELLAAAEDARVDLKHPEVDVRLELIDDTLRLVSRRHPGLGGYPLGTQGQALALISGGYDSPVAAWHLLRRGLKIHYLFFSLGGPAHEAAVREVVHHVWSRYGVSHRVNFVSVPFEGVVDEIQRRVPAGLAGVVLKRMMLRAANRVARRARIPALITGDALAQVSSQSLVNLGLIDAVSERPVLRPLIASDKQTIIGDARHIGTAAHAAALPEYCGTIARRPHVKPRPAQITEAEAAFDDAVLDSAIAASTLTPVDRLLDTAPALPDIPTVDSREALAALPEATVIDIRHPDEREAAPLVLPHGEVLAIPFFELADRAPALRGGRRYLLYCARGVMSRMQAMHLADRGLTGFGVYRPE
ncbi:tRNA 4-thiouridine(8) synthase ThiI [Modicisalibacter tunisiensis]|uniref:tRNA uracil 4-sulfurtransferase ThiI n=1 Tax=Modicisalibacter TaxID=574347 RepID=UPI0013D730D0|nr:MULTISPECIES: tRNA uracil 4-sulfurtransferase ThiI [Modicisalibacter]MBZ9538409.1 tRNA 4-thiouridine(8) synthase ThiI [Modicisalibacter tunisiensis]